MEEKRKRVNFRATRCDQCKLHPNLCVCGAIVPQTTRTKITLVMPRVESQKPTNTGLLATYCLPNSDVFHREYNAPEPEALDPDYQSLLLFPGEDAVCLSTYRDDPRPVQLIVPDGTWRQATKMRRRVPCLRPVPRVILPDGPPSEYQLRRGQPEGRLSTMEAVARALGVLEGPEVQAHLEHIFRLKVDRYLWQMGKIAKADIYGGIAPGVFAHDPLSGLPGAEG
ncbi:tRNA-uridine aminocarboxypropyltransferase [Acanthopleuribacter pedis]|uniref:tRNA-uridine aminocarboxypropyltransferase n=1 Tax=Acanthopleuribacter pedis TaxID=442870 RepID=A0A8J7Q5C4_9BACT|nr:tRNA-uridine aminocarboxypropyltransferase [Acanthopleuribacter pedis]MBO1318226.1 DTW domain-containing protein [Acanthopleuribacter pedis]